MSKVSYVMTEEEVKSHVIGIVERNYGAGLALQVADVLKDAKRTEEGEAVKHDFAIGSFHE